LESVMKTSHPSPASECSDLSHVRERLDSARRDLLREIASADEDLQRIEETREAELGERSQEEDAAARLAWLKDRLFARLRTIEGALQRVTARTYGRCVACSAGIGAARLAADPAVALCTRCARARATAARTKLLRAPVVSPEPMTGWPRLPAELRNFDDGELAEYVRERLREEVGTAIHRMRVVCRHGRVVLGGEVASRELDQVARRIVEDEIGLEVVDHVRLDADFSDGSAPVASLGSLLDAGQREQETPDADENDLDFTPSARPVPEV
jgi:DnaK suppressor protein